MGIESSPRRRHALVSVLAATATLAAALAIGMVAVSGVSRAATPAPQPRPAVFHSVPAVAERVTQAFWTPLRMETATPLRGRARRGTAGSPGPGSPGSPGPGSPGTASTGTASTASPGTVQSPPPGTPTAKPFHGVPTVGALFYTTGTGRHFCTASVVDSPRKDMVLTAAHCVYSSTYASNVEFVPGYHDGRRPYGAWPVTSITVAAGWQQSHQENLDFAFLSVAPPSGARRPIQAVTGGLRLGINRGYAHHIEVIGYNNTDDWPVRCATKSFEAEPGQMEFYCHNYWDGTSGGPWITGYHRTTGTGTVIGDIGGYEQGGDYEWASYSPYFSRPTLDLFRQAESHHA